MDKDIFQDGREQGWRDKEPEITRLRAALEDLLEDDQGIWDTPAKERARQALTRDK